MEIVEIDSSRLHFEDQTVSQKVWIIGGILFGLGLLALAWLPGSYRFVGLLGWMVVWTVSLFILPRWLGDKIRVTVDSARREIVWLRNGQTLRSISFTDIKGFEIGPLVTASRPYQAFQLFVTLKNGSRITLAVDPKEMKIQKAIRLARERLR